MPTGKHVNEEGNRVKPRAERKDGTNPCTCASCDRADLRIRLDAFEDRLDAIDTYDALMVATLTERLSTLESEVSALRAGPILSFTTQESVQFGSTVPIGKALGDPRTEGL